MFIALMEIHQIQRSIVIEGFHCTLKTTPFIWVMD